MTDLLKSLTSFSDKYSAPIQSFMNLGSQFEALNIKKSAAQSQINSLSMAGDTQYIGGILSAEGYRKSKTSVASATAYNLIQDNLNVQREMQSLSRQFQRTIGEQIVSTAAQGISLSSKSALMLRNETVNVYDEALLQLKLSAENNIRNRLYESKLKQTELEQQARASEYQAKLARVNAANRIAEIEATSAFQEKQTTSSLFKNVPTVLRQISEVRKK